MSELALQAEKLSEIKYEAVLSHNNPDCTVGRSYSIIKRMFDIAASLVLGLILLLPMAVIALVIRISSRGSVIFRQERLGLCGKSFTILKFRSMYVDAEANGPQWAHEDDKRCTPIGRILRKTRLDELPQLWNILKGEMSFVGPRPERPFFYDLFEGTIPKFRMRLQVKPGLTGLAQVNGGYDLEPEEKLKYDLNYIENRSIWMDIQCLFKTIRLVFTHEGAR